MTLKENRDGARGSTVWPRASMAVVRGEALSEPEVMQSLSAVVCEASPKVSWKVFSERVISFTAMPVRRVTPASLAAFMKQSMMVWELSVSGNIRPSGSVLRVTPRWANQAMVSCGWKRWKAPRSSREPRG